MIGSGCHKDLSRVDVRDIADAAVTALREQEHEGAYPLVGSDTLTGKQTAATSTLGSPKRKRCCP
jgi:uncharacterized protein YbjT (DUF2867 family)